MQQQLDRFKSLPGLNTAGLLSAPVEKTQQNGSAVPAQFPEIGPEHIKPFEHGFKREVVKRAVQDSSRPLSDVYYHSPDGQKLRSRPEIGAYLVRRPNLPLTLDNFTFARKPIYHPPEEVVRQASRHWKNSDGVPSKRANIPTQASKTSSSASARTALLGSMGDEPVADLPVPCVGRHEGLSVRQSTRKQCLCCRESPTRRKRLRGTEPSNGAASPQAKRDRRPVGPGSHTTKAQAMKARQLGGRSIAPPKAIRNSRPTSRSGPGRPAKQGRAQSPGLPAKLTAYLPAAAVGEREKRSRQSRPRSPFFIYDGQGTLDDYQDESSNSDDDASFESSPKRPFVLLEDVLRKDGASPKLGMASSAGRSSLGDSGSVVPITLQAGIPPWKNSVSWEIYELLKNQSMKAGGTVPDGEGGETAALKPGSSVTPPRPTRPSQQGKSGCNDEEQCAADWLKGGPTVVEDSTEALEVVLEDAETGSSVVLENSPTSAQQSRQRTPASVALKGSPTTSGTPSVLCGINCPRAVGQTPQLVCTRCLCHFHPVCVGLKDIHPHVTGGQFICKPCSKASYHRAGKGPSPEKSTQPTLADGAASSTKPPQAQGPCTAFVVSSVASMTALPSSLPRPSFGTSVGGVLAVAGSSSGTVSVPVVQFVDGASTLSPLRFVYVSTEPQSGRPSLLPPTLAISAPAPALPVQVNTQPLRMPSLMAAPRPLNPVAAVVRPQGIPTLRLQSGPSPNPTQYYAIHLKHKLSDIDMASLSALVQQAALKGPAELQRVCNGQGVVLQKAAPLPSLPAGPSSSVPQLTTAPQLMASVSQALATTQLTSASALRPVSGSCSVLKKPNVTSESSAPSAASVPASSLKPPASVVAAQKLEPGNVPPVTQGQEKALASGAGTNSQTVVSGSACMEAALIVPKTELETTIRIAVPATRHRPLLPKLPGGTQAVSGNEPSSTANIASSEADGVVRAAATMTCQDAATTAGIPTRPGECPEAAVEERLQTPVTTLKIQDVVSLAGGENEWPLASDKSEAEGRLVMVEGEAAKGPSNHVDWSASASRKDYKGTMTAVVSTKGEKPTKRPLLELSVPPTPPSDSNHSAEATTESSASEQGPSNASTSGVVNAQGSRKVARVKRVKRRKPQGANASPSTSSPLWVRTQRQLVFARDRPSPLDPLALHRDLVPNSARAFADLDCAMMALNSIFSWLPLPSLCSAAQVCKSWNIAANSPFLWKQIDFRQFHVKDWKACVMKMRFRCPEELILDGESLDCLVPLAEHLCSVERVSLEGNPRQLAAVPQAFPALRSLRAVVKHKGSAAAAAAAASQNGGNGGEGVGEPLPPWQASLGCLVELLCIKGLERLELSGAHGLALLPQNMTPSTLAERCQQLRSLSLTTVQQLTPMLMFPFTLLKQLEELHLGNCTQWSRSSFVQLGELRELRRLTLEFGEDGLGFHEMLRKLSRLESLELKHWVLRDSLCGVLPHMKQLRSLLLWPHLNSLASRTHRNILRSCLSVNFRLERFTWIVGCKQVGQKGSGLNKMQSLLLVQHVAPALLLNFEPGNLCGCPSAADPVPASSASPSEASETATCASPNTKGRKNASNVSTENATASNATTSAATNCTSPCKSATAPSSNPEASCCPLAKTISEVWKPSSEETWHMTLRQLCDGLQRLMEPRTAVCVCVHVES